MPGRSQKKDRYGLTASHRAFADAYLVSNSISKAAVTAGYSAKTCEQVGCALIKIPEVQAYIQKRMDERSQRTLITADDVLKSIKDIRDECRENGKNSDALKANEMLGKHLRLFADVVEHKVDEAFADRITAALARSAKV